MDENGLCVGRWLTNQRRKFRAGNLSKEQEALLRSAGVGFDDYTEKLWTEGYRQAAQYYAVHHNTAIPVAYKTESNFALGEWLRTQVKLEKSGKLREERKLLLDRLDVQWKSNAATTR